MRWFSAACVSLALTFALTGCGGGDDSSSTTAPSAAASDEPTATPSASESTVEPNVGDAALRVGQKREGTDIVTTVLDYKAAGDANPPSYLKGEDDAAGALVRVSECVRDSAPQAYTLGSYDFTLQDATGGAYTPASSSWDDWPTRPQMPSEQSVRPGSCISGWVLMSVPKDAQVTSVALGDADRGVVAEWAVE